MTYFTKYDNEFLVDIVTQYLYFESLPKDVTYETEEYSSKKLSKRILTAANVDLNKKAKDLTEAELTAIRAEVDKYLVEGDLRREIKMNIKTKMEINSYQGVRHKKKLPVRGQRTNRNAVTARGGKKKVVANKKK